MDSAMECTSDGDSEVEAYGAGTYALLVSGDLKVMNDEGLYQCPFCSDEMADFNLSDLLQHALDVGVAHEREAKDKADHRALAKHLNDKHAESPGSLLQPALTDLQAPQHNKEEEFIWPWMCILVNMPNEYFGKSANRLKEHFSSFHPVKVHPVYSKGCPTRDAILEFGKDWIGFRNARAFESNFSIKGYGKMHWKEMKSGCSEPFGWMGRADDYNSLGEIGDLLRKIGDLKTFNDIKNEETDKTDKLLANLTNQVKEKEMNLVELKSEYDQRVAAREIMMQKKEQLYQLYKQEIQKVRQGAQQNTQRVLDENWKLRSDLQGMMDELDARNKQIEELAAQSDHDKRNLELEKQKNAMKTNHLRLAALEQQKADENVQKLMEQQNRETTETLEKFKKLSIQLEVKQNLELEINHLMGKLQVMEHKPSDEDPESWKTIDELKEELKEKLDELKATEDFNESLIIRESKISDELHEARGVLIQALQGLPCTATGEQPKIGIKRIGELHSKAFLSACKRKFQEDAEVESAFLCSKWQNEINNPVWRPFKVIMVDGKESEVLREDDEKLQELKEYGEEAYSAVTKALIELKDNGGRAVPLLWNYEKGRKAQMKEAVRLALELWKTRNAKSNKRR
ncbi:hypothetical protein ACP70R_041298 [Stipagrostis hirtigluma subsp. patula]